MANGREHFSVRETSVRDLEPVKDIIDRAGFPNCLMGDQDLADEIFAEYPEAVLPKFIALKETHIINHHVVPIGCLSDLPIGVTPAQSLRKTRQSS